jgi:hypothetical protein
MKESVTFTGQVSFAMHYRATRAVVARSKVMVFNYGFFIGVPLLVIVSQLFEKRDVSRPSVVGIPVWLLLLTGPVFVLLFLPLCHALNVWQRRRNNASLQGVLTWTFGTEGFESHGGTFDVRLRWDGINRVVETKDFLLVYIAASTAHFVPKTCAATPQDLGKARAIIKQAIGARARLLAG